jgi:hypothetical protein
LLCISRELIHHLLLLQLFVLIQPEQYESVFQLDKQLFRLEVLLGYLLNQQHAIVSICIMSMSW